MPVTMKLAEALRLKIDLKKQLDQLKDRIQNATLVEKDEEVNTTAYSALQTFDVTSQRLLKLSVAINKANTENTVTYASFYDNIKDYTLIGDTNSNNFSEKMATSTKSVMEALVERDRLNQDVNSLKDIARRAEVRPRYSVDDVKKKSTIDPKKLQKRLDAMSKYLRLMDTRLQENNWLVGLDFE